jgi:hypothetical protein
LCAVLGCGGRDVVRLVVESRACVADADLAMFDVEVSAAANGAVTRRVLSLRILGLVAGGGVVLLVISLPAVGEAQQAQPGVGWYVAHVLVVAAAMSRAYVLVRRFRSVGLS